MKLTSIPDKEYEENNKINVLIDKVESKAKELFNKVAFEKRKPTEFKLINLFYTTDEKFEKRATNFFDVFDDFISTNKTDKAERTIKGYITVPNYLKPLYNAITFHTARKTFITNSIMLGVNIKHYKIWVLPKRKKT